MGLGNFFKNNAGSLVGSAIGVAGNLIGGSMSDKRSASASRESWLQNYNAQKEFAQNSILWRVQDAKRAGINPNAVVGGQTVGYTPQDISRTQDFATGVSRAGNMLANTLGQLQLATAKEDLKSKKLENDKKSVELANAVIKKNMGQVPKTVTNVIEGNIGGELQTFGDGSQIIKTKNGAGIDEPLSFAADIAQRFDRASHEALAKHSGHHLGLGFGGYKTIPPKKLSFHERAMLDASNYAGKHNNAARGVLRLINSYLQNALDEYIKPVTIGALKHWFFKP